MKRAKFFVCFLALVFVFSQLSLYAQALTLDKVLGELSKPRLTSLQRLELVEKYKDLEVKGIGKIKDILKSYGSENEALVYLIKSYAGKSYELVLITDRASAEKVNKGKLVRFEAKFVGMSFETLRFKDAKITAYKSWWPFFFWAQ